MKKSPNLASGVTGSVITAIRRARCPRGSRQRPVRRWSRCSWNQRRFSPIVLPGSRPRPLVRSRMPIPAVWKSIVPSTRSERIATSRMRTMRLRGASPCQAIQKPPTPNACHRARVGSRQVGDMRSSVGVDGGGTLSERVGPDGAVLLPLALEEVPAVVRTLKQEDVESVAVCLLHSYANPQHERALRAALAPHFAHLSVSSEINAEFREYERTSTTVLNAAVMPLASRYLDELVAALGREAQGAVLHLLHSAGGMMSAEAARARPLAMAASGPAAGVAAAAHLARSLGLARALAFDMGGTTTDVCLIADGVAETSAQTKLGGHPVRLPMVAVESIGAGGGSIAYADEAGALQVGPRSAGAEPGPACYGLGGAEPTVTDANLV